MRQYYDDVPGLKRCDLPIPVRTKIQAPRSEWSQWASQFNLVNWLGLAMFLLPICLGYVIVHAWLLEYDLFLYYASLYAQLGLILIAWRQLR